MTTKKLDLWVVLVCFCFCIIFARTCQQIQIKHALHASLEVQLMQNNALQGRPQQLHACSSCMVFTWLIGGSIPCWQLMSGIIHNF